MKTKIILSLLFILILTTSCSTQLKSRDVTQYYSGMGLEKYFLSEIPAWANFSSVGNCFRSKSIQYLDIGALMKSFNLSFVDALQIQATFNEDYLEVKKDSNLKITFKDLEIIYFKANQKVTGKINFFDAPDFKTIHLIWLDEVLADKTLEKEKKLKNFLQSDVHNNGFPILVSACLTKSEITEKFPGLSAKILSAELFSSFDNLGSVIPGLRLDLGSLFKANQSIIFYTQKSPRFNDDIRGNYKPLAY